jgi:hypothetical protein
LLSSCFRADAGHYLQIAKEGYSYSTDSKSTVAFFPVYPLTGRCVSSCLGVTAEVGALLTANVALAGAFVLFAAYLSRRWPEQSREQRALALALFGLWPASMFLRMPYAESLFVLGTVAVLYGMAQQWPLWVLAVVAGAVTATRPVGVAVAAAVVWYAWVRLPHPPVRRAIVVAGLFLVSIWGLLAYMGYQAVTFDAPLGFAQTQEHWSMSAPQDRSWGAKVESLAVFEPIWSVYDPASPRYWGRHGDRDEVFGIFFWNPIFFLLALVLTLVGWYRGWLSGAECVLGLGLLVIPYLTRSYEMSMASHARFGMVVVVQYPVLARLAAGHSYRTVGLLLICSVMLFAWTALYVTGHTVF